MHALLTKPAGYVAGTKIPMLLRIHGGPNGQDQHSFAFERQSFAANGYAVLAGPSGGAPALAIPSRNPTDKKACTDRVSRLLHMTIPFECPGLRRNSNVRPLFGIKTPSAIACAIRHV